MKSTLAPYKGIWPQIADNVFLSDGVRILGNVTIADSVSVWFNSVLRGDENFIRIGRFTNIQDNTTIHVEDEYPCIIGDYVTVGHNSLLHGCTISSNCIIGMGSIVMNGVKIGENSIVGAGSLITENKVIPPCSLVVGSPARVIRTLDQSQIDAIRESAEHYQKMALDYINYAKIKETEK